MVRAAFQSVAVVYGLLRGPRTPPAGRAGFLHITPFSSFVLSKSAKELRVVDFLIYYAYHNILVDSQLVHIFMYNVSRGASEQWSILNSTRFLKELFKIDHCREAPRDTFFPS